ncbi:MAG: carboxypeptidase regulatory-like domain-containing protein [Cryomorphaceae bacterium]
MKLTFVICFVFCSAQMICAQNYGEIHGQLMDYNSQTPLPYANVTTTYGGQLKGTTTDENGRFRLKPLQPGTYDVTFKYLGYDTRILQRVEVTPGKINILGKIELAQDNELPTIEIVGHKLINKDQPNAIVMRAAELKHNALLNNPAQLVGSITPELQTDEGGNFLVRGGRPGTSATFLDGVRLMGPLGRIPGSAIKTITVHTGGIPAKYGDVTGGIVVIETKSYFDYFYENNPRER